jgi:DNA-binding transcriptional LysR family regulator
LRYAVVFEDEVVLAVPAGDPLAARGEVPASDLAAVAFIDREGGSGTVASARQTLAVHGHALPDHRPVMTLGSTAAVVAAVERGLGAGWVSTLALAGRSPQRVAAVRVAGIPLRRPLFMIEATG